MPKTAARAFTLVELLTVMAMAALVLSMAVPAMSNLAKGGQMNQAITEISGILEQARQYAVAQNTYVWVAFDDTPTTSEDRVRVVVLASKSGTDLPAWGTDDTSSAAAQTRLLNRVKTFSNVKLSGAGTFGSSQIASLPAVGAAGPGVADFRVSLPGGTVQKFDQAIQFTPSGEARNSAGMAGQLEFGLQPTANLVPDTKNVAVARVNGLTGQSTVYRP
jgi:prepilin-type N-terminal cleavage/methylation domain-containing protein